MAHLPVLAASKIFGRRPIIPPFEPKYMPVPLSPLSSWGSLAQALGPSQVLGYAPDISGRVVPSTSLFAGGDDSDGVDTDTDQFIGGDDYP